VLLFVVPASACLSSVHVGTMFGKICNVAALGVVSSSESEEKTK